MLNIMPALGLGTFRLQDEVVVHAVREALALGYRLIDTAQIYGNEAEIGRAIAESGVSREQLFLTTKIWTENLGGERLISSLKQSLQRLRAEAVDLCLIHWPSPGGAVPLAESLQALAEAQSQGLTARIGLSNFPVALMREAVSLLGPGRLFTNQVELHPYLQNRPLVQAARELGLGISSYMTLAYGEVLRDTVVQSLAAARGVTPAQLVLAWALQRGFAVMPSSTRREHLQSNLHATELRLSEAEMAALAALDAGRRLVNPEGLAPAWDPV